MSKLPATLIEINTEDGLTLPGLLFEAPNSTRVAIFLHGNGSQSVFYDQPKLALLAEQLNNQGISLLAFNNRGANIIKKLDKTNDDGSVVRIEYGTAYELIKECVLDVDACVKALNGHGYKTFYLIGHSTGANKICVYKHYKPRNAIRKYVLAAGGDDSGIYYEEFGYKRFNKILIETKKAIDEDRGREQASPLITDVMGFMSNQAVFDTLNPDGDYNTFPFNDALNDLDLSKHALFRYFKEITKPTLVIYGSQDEYCYGDAGKIVDLLKSNQNNKARNSYELVDGADHGFSQQYRQFTEKIADYLDGDSDT